MIITNEEKTDLISKSKNKKTKLSPNIHLVFCQIFKKNNIRYTLHS